MYLTRRNRLQKNYLNTNFYVGGQRINLTEPGDYMMSFLASQGILTWAIITSDNPRSFPMSRDENDKMRMELESNLRKLKYNFSEATGRGEEGWEENGFFIHDILLKDARALARKYKQYAFIFGNEQGEAELKWVRPTHRENIERLLLTRVRGCIHRRDCTTGCWEREARVLLLNKVTPEVAREIVQKWRTEGVPEHWLKEEDFPFEFWMRDFEYKESVINVLERMIQRGR